MSYRAVQAEQRRQERVTQKRLRELERQAKEIAKSSELEQARLEVAMYEARADALLSMHKEHSPCIDWVAHVAALPPCPPAPGSCHQVKARIAHALASDQDTNLLEQNRCQDEREFNEALASHSAQHQQWLRMRELAARVIAGEHKAYVEAITELSGLSELSNLGSALHFTVHSEKVLEARVAVRSGQVIPNEVKTLTSTGKVAVRKMPKNQFHELYQDYVCACVLRIGRELFSLLPIDLAITTAYIDEPDAVAINTREMPVLSVVLRREQMSLIDFEQCDPSDTIATFRYRGDFKGSRKKGEFERVVPFIPEDLGIPIEPLTFEDLLASAVRQCDELAGEIVKLKGSTRRMNPEVESL